MLKGVYLFILWHPLRLECKTQPCIENVRGKRNRLSIIPLVSLKRGAFRNRRGTLILQICKDLYFLWQFIFISFFISYYNHHSPGLEFWRSNVVLVRHWSREPIKLVDTEKLKPNNNNNTGIVSHVMSHNKNNHFLLSRSRKQLD